MPTPSPSKKKMIKPGKKQTFEQAQASVMKRHGKVFARLAEQEQKERSKKA
jgi:hypothetical protein